MKVLYGLVYTFPFFNGLAVFNQRMIAALRDKVQLHLLVGDSGELENLDRPGVHTGEREGLPAVFARRSNEVTRFTKPGDNAAIDNLIDTLTDYLVSTRIDLVHMAEWESLGVAIFAAANKAGIPWIITPVDYRLVCGQVFLFERNLKACSGPDEGFKKCSRCIATQRHQHNSYKGKLKGLAKDLLFSLGLTGLLRGYAPPERWQTRDSTIKEYLNTCSAIVPHSESHKRELQRLLGFSDERFSVIDYGVELPSDKYCPSPDRFSPPLRFAWIHRMAREWGFWFVLEAWKRAGVPPCKAQLWLYTSPGAANEIRKTRYKALLDKGAVVVREERVRGQEDKVYADLAAVIIASQWKDTGGAPALEGIVRKVPAIVPDRYGASETVIEGINGFHYEHGNVDALAALIRRCCETPGLLERVASTCYIQTKHMLKVSADCYVQLYEQVLQHHKNRSFRHLKYSTGGQLHCMNR